MATVTRSFTVAGLLLTASAVGIWSVWANLSADGPHLLYWAWLFYAPSWLVFNALFGGIHGAPTWTIMPSVVLAVVSQNLILYSLGRWLARRLRPAQKL